MGRVGEITETVGGLNRNARALSPKYAEGRSVFLSSLKSLDLPLECAKQYGTHRIVTGHEDDPGVTF
jgi:hypothetical protein